MLPAAPSTAIHVRSRNSWTYSVLIRLARKLSGDMPDRAGNMPALPKTRLSR